MSGLASDGEDEFKPFRYRRIRRIVCKRCSPDRISMECDCGFFERTCVICRHLLKLLKVVLVSWGFDTQQWHRSLLKKFYNDVLLTSKNVGGSKKFHCQQYRSMLLNNGCERRQPAPREYLPKDCLWRMAATMMTTALAMTHQKTVCPTRGSGVHQTEGSALKKNAKPSFRQLCLCASETLF